MASNELTNLIDPRIFRNEACMQFLKHVFANIVHHLGWEKASEADCEAPYALIEQVPTSVDLHEPT